MYTVAWIIKYFYLHLVLDPHNYLLTQKGEVIKLGFTGKGRP